MDRRRNLLRIFLDARWVTQGESKLGLGADELQELEHALRAHEQPQVGCN